MTIAAPPKAPKAPVKPDQQRVIDAQPLSPLPPRPPAGGDLMRSIEERRIRAAEAEDLAVQATLQRLEAAEQQLEVARKALSDLPEATVDELLESQEIVVSKLYKQLAEHKQRVADECRRATDQERIDALRDNAALIVESAQQALDRAAQLLSRVVAVDAEARTLRGLHGCAPARVFETPLDHSLIAARVPQLRRSDRGDWVLEPRPLR